MDYSYLTNKKERLNQYKLFPTAYTKNIDKWFCVEFTYASNAIEGNTLTAQQTAMMIEKGLTIGGKTVCEHLEAVNHAKAISVVRELATKKAIEISSYDILRIHELILHDYPIAVIQKEQRRRIQESLETAHVTGNLSAFEMLIAAATERSLDIYLSDWQK